MNRRLDNDRVIRSPRGPEISARSWFTNFLTRPADTSNPTLTRFQLDAVVKF